MSNMTPEQRRAFIDGMGKEPDDMIPAVERAFLIGWHCQTPNPQTPDERHVWQQGWLDGWREGLATATRKF